ncbi:MAG TPA: hypothetical protein VF981_16545 [Gemmatimonadaceae bacterium]
MRTKEQGLLTTADAMQIATLEIQLRGNAHGGDFLASRECVACRGLSAALGEWLGAHVAGEEELDELEAARREP